MRTLLAVALAATSIPVFTTAALAREGASAERRVCTQLTVRAGSHLSGRRVCRTPTEWREALGPDWRQRLAGYDNLQSQYDSLAARASPDNEVHGVQPDPHSPGAQAPSPN